MIYKKSDKSGPISQRDQAWRFAADITNIVWWRCEGGPLLSDDDELVFSIVLPFLLKTRTPGLGPRNIETSIDWARQYTPRVLLNGDEWLGDAERQAREEIERQAKENPKVVVDQISKALLVIQDEVDRLKLYCLVDHNRTVDVRQEDRKENDRLRKVNDNRKQGRKDRRSWLADTKATSAAKAALAEQHSVSVQTINKWIRNGKIEFPGVSDTLLNGLRTDLETPEAVVVDVLALPLNDNKPDPDFSDIQNIRTVKSSIRYYQMTFPAIAYDLHVLHAHLKEMDAEAAKIRSPGIPIRYQKRLTAWVLAELGRRNVAAGGRKPFREAA